MKSEELAFYNQQLAGMLRSGLPLEGALAEVSRELKRGKLKEETLKLKQDLSQGIDLAEAVRRRAFPALYQRLMVVGAHSERLEEMLISIADYYHRSGIMWNRLKGIAIYPLIVLLASFCLTFFLAWTIMTSGVFALAGDAVNQWTLFENPIAGTPVWVIFCVLFTPAFLGILSLIYFAGVFVPSFRRTLVWRIPGFRDASLAQTAAACSTMLRSGLPLNDAVEILSGLETHKPTRDELAGWNRRIAQGIGGFGKIARASRSIPGMFIWLVASSGEALADGFDKAATFYQRRADYRADLALAAALPVSVLLIGGMVVFQLIPLHYYLSRVMSASMMF